MRATRPCPVCGFINLKESERCLKCGAVLGDTDVADLLNRKTRRGKLRSWIGNALERLLAPLRRWGQGTDEEPEPPAGDLPGIHRGPLVAGWLALLPGAGHWYVGRKRRALGFAALHLLLTAAVFLTLTRPWGNLVLAAWILFLLVAFTDAAAAAARGNGQLWTRRHSLAMFSYLLFALGAGAFLVQVALTPVISLVTVRQNVLRPVLAKGDRVLVWSAGYWMSEPRRGDLVYYDPPMYQLDIPGEIENTTYLVNEQRSFERVNAIGGDVVERIADGPLLLNGDPMPEAYYPLFPEGIPGTFRIQVPKGKYLVMISHISEEGFMSYGSFGGRSVSPGSKGIIPTTWADACVVPGSVIFGKVLAVVNPPEHRRWVED